MNSGPASPDFRGSRGTAAVVVTWNGLPLLRRNLPSWDRQSQPFVRRIVVDNGSRDETVRWLAGRPSVDVLRLSGNRGFAAGANAGFRAALADGRVDAVALINNDVLLDPGWNAAARAELLAAPDVGACATCLVQERDPGRIDGAGIVWPEPGWADNARHGEPAGPAAPEDVPGVSAGAALYRARFLRETGGFDERLFAYQEDVDLSIRGRRAGWRYRYVPAARGTHAGHGSNRRFFLGGSLADYFNARNRLYVLFKSGPGPGWEDRKGVASRILRRAAGSSLKERRAGAVWAGLLHGLLWWPLARRARHAAPVPLQGGAPPSGAGP